MATDRELDDIYNRLDDAFIHGYFEAVNEELKQVNVADVDTVLLIGYLTISWTAKEKLPYRAEFFEKCRQEFLKRGEKEDDLLKNLD